jgi:oligoribonuclease
VPLCGNSIGTDRRFLQEYMPTLEAFLHYRNVDVSTIKELARRWYPEVLEAMPEKESAHRALDDIRESIEELKYYRDALFPPRPAPPRTRCVRIPDLGRRRRRPDDRARPDVRDGAAPSTASR